LGKTIWYISKYAVSPNFGPPSRQFFFSKYFNIKGYQTVLISSHACGIKYSTNIDFEKYFKIYETEGIKHYLLKGPLISLGFSLKRILSWVQFEWYVFKLGNDIGKKQKPDAIIVSSLSLLTIINGIYFKWKFGCKFILEIRDIWPLTLIEIGSYSRYNPIILFLGFIEQIGYKYSDNIIGFQARRLNTRVRREDKSLEFAHMNDATVVAIGRTLIAIMENYQKEDGTIVVPEILRPYVGRDIIS